jgi:isoleucyl-tRNA synthetase
VSTQRRFQPVDTKNASFPRLEEEVLARWREQDILRRVEEARADAPLFVFYEGPPTANGRPGIHHVLSRSFKDVILRYKTMRGYRPLRRGGWDTHGLPVELEVEKALGLSTKHEIEQFGIEEFNRRCRESVFQYVKDWEAMTERVGVWLDMDTAYVTYHNSYVESAWWVFKRLWEQGRVYEGFRVTPHCPRCVTSLSSHEVALGYKDETPDPSVYVRFPMRDDQAGHGANAGVLARLGHDGTGFAGTRPAFLAWTTTPWTLTANMALAVGPAVTYVLAEAPAGEDGQPGERLVLAEPLASSVLGEGWTVLERFTGEELAGVRYSPPFANPDLAAHPHRVLTADYVSTADGTGIVHTAPAYGAEDAELGRANGFATVHTVDLHGVLAEGFPGGGRFFKEADKALTADLDERGLLYRSGTIKHTYPFCWRCSTPLLYYAKASWYIRTTDVKDRMVAGNQGINWYPEHIKEGRFGEWLRNNIDWAVSRERYWGTPLPIWRCDADPAHQHVVGSTAELRERATPETVALTDELDLHRPFVDRVLITCTADGCTGTMHRVPEVADAWYDSGAMPFAQWSYPTTVTVGGGRQVTLRGVDDLVRSDLFPADFITEAVDQTRGWFYSLLALATLVADEPSYRNVIVLGLILDGKGEKMSKSKGNVVDPWEVVGAQGADALRWYLYTAAPAGAARRFSADLVGETLRRFLLTLWNTYSFFTTYADLDGFDPDANASFWKGPIGGPALASAPPNELDRWVISELNELVAHVTADLDGYSPTDAGRRIEEFVDRLSNWYLRRSRRRFWKSESDQDKTWAYVTLYTCLHTLSRLMAPMTPFLADAMYRNLAAAGSPDSVHLADYPEADPALVDESLDAAVRLAMRIASLGRAARAKAGVKVRQPLARALVRVRTEEAALLPRIAEQVADELNVKAVEPAPDDAFAFRLKANLPVLGPRLGGRIGPVRKAVESADGAEAIRTLREHGFLELGGERLEADDLLIEVAETAGIAAAMEGAARLVVGVDTTLTDDLRAEGFARELVRRVQDARKAAGLEVDDRISLAVSGGGEALTGVLAAHGPYIAQETLATAISQEAPAPGAHTETHDVEGVPLTIAITRAG